MESRWRLQEIPDWFYRHARFMFALAGIVAGSGIFFAQECLLIPPHIKRPLGCLMILSVGMLGLAAGNIVQILYREADTDPLTRLGNRRWFNRQLTEELRQVRDCERHSVLVLVDIDNFKYINDTFGYPAGDQVLVRISNIFKRNLGFCDSVMRWGGDEFVFIFRKSSEEKAGLALERIRQELRDDPVIRQVTISAGLTALTPQMSPGQALKQAARLLSKAKQSKNMVRIR